MKPSSVIKREIIDIFKELCSVIAFHQILVTADFRNTCQRLLLNCPITRQVLPWRCDTDLFAPWFYSLNLKLIFPSLDQVALRRVLYGVFKSYQATNLIQFISKIFSKWHSFLHFFETEQFEEMTKFHSHILFTFSDVMHL